MRILKIAALAIVAAGLLGGGATLTSAPAKAQGVSVDIGAGPGVRYRDDDYWRYHRRYRAETFGEGCRRVIRRVWRGDHEVVIRRRDCD